jgi:hypothetical protein
MVDKADSRNAQGKAMRSGAGIVLGIGFGIAVGVATSNLGLGMVIGIGMAAILGALMRRVR